MRLSVSAVNSSRKDAETLENQIDALKLENGKLSERNKGVQESFEKTSAELNEERQKVIDLNSSLSSIKSDYNNLQEKLSEQKKEVEELQSKFIKEFENLANKILDDKSTKFTAQNKENLDQILKPLKES